MSAPGSVFALYAHEWTINFTIVLVGLHVHVRQLDPYVLWVCACFKMSLPPVRMF